LIDTARTTFNLGQLVATPGAIETMAEGGHDPLEFLRRHACSDWGVVCDEDKQANEDALVNGSRLLSAYKTANDDKLWVITEAEDSHGHRSATTILLPSEY
jgi:hypothetical protein